MPKSQLMSWPLLTVVLLAAASSVPAATLPDGFAETQVATGLDPTAMSVAPDGRVFIAEKAGRIRVVKNDVLLATPFAVLSNINNQNEAGLDGICLHPDFASNGWVYAYYTSTVPTTHNRVVRFTASGDVADGAPTLIFAFDAAGGVHNGGAMHFGTDGKLYVGSGDVGNSSLAQSMTSLQGKVLRLNADGSIPADNPFFNTASGVYRSIWALGLRNPFNAAVQPGTGRYFVNDVGGAGWEEINVGQPGHNFGWPTTEGPHNDSRFANPVYAYQHNMGCAITGGVFYNPSVQQFPSEYVGRYFFGDYCGNWVRTIDPTAADPSSTVQVFATNLNRPLDFRVAPDGSMYYLSRGGMAGGSADANTSSNSGSLWRVRYTANQAPSIAAQPQNVTVPIGGNATFTASVSGSEPLAYQWQRNGSDIAGATSSSYSVSNAQLADNGATFRLRVTNAFGSVTSDAATLTVTSNQPPVATITAPNAGATYAGGDSIIYSGSASDTEDGTIPASGLTWRIDFHHDDHDHPVLTPTTGVTGGTLVVPTTGETSANVWYRITLTARDSAGLTSTTIRDIQPRTARMTFQTVPAGLMLELDGAPISVPSTVTGVTGITRRMTAPTQTVAGTTWVFSGWSDGGVADHEFATPAIDTTYTATFIDQSANSGLTREWWTGVSGTSVAQIPLNSPPNGREVMTSFEAPTNWADEYGTRVRGYLVPPTSGSYRFWIAGDDNCELWLSSSADPSLRQRIAWVNDWTYSREWDKESNQQSAAVDLIAGERYYIEALHKEGTAGDNLAVGWLMPGQSGSLPSEIVPGSALQPWDGGAPDPDNNPGDGADNQPPTPAPPGDDASGSGPGRCGAGGLVGGFAFVLLMLAARLRPGRGV